jgi:hypothetical protein
MPASTSGCLRFRENTLVPANFSLSPLLFENRAKHFGEKAPPIPQVSYSIPRGRAPRVFNKRFY